MKYIAIKGSVCVDGVSLTVTDISSSSFQVSLIPFSKENTTLGLKRVGDPVNIEVDMLARYLERLVSYGEEYKSNNNNIDQEFLRKHGFM
jgi:riboflavin synthase